MFSKVQKWEGGAGNDRWRGDFWMTLRTLCFGSVHKLH